MRQPEPWTTDDMPDQSGKVAVITGANSGLGLESAKALAARGAKVVLACRNPQRGQEALSSVSAVASEEPVLQQLDLADLESVESAANDLESSLDHVDVLMNNAGVMALPERRTAQGFEMQMGTNHLGHFAFTGHLLPLLLAADAPRVVTTASQMHRIGKMHWDDLNWSRRYMKWPAYGQSKLANLLFAMELSRRAAEAGSSLVSAAAHPGYASTHLQQTGPEMSGRNFAARLMELGNRIVAQPAASGALPQLFAATAPEVRNGSYYGPGGIGEMHGSPKQVKPMKVAHDREEGHRLWNISENLTGVHFEWPARV